MEPRHQEFLARLSAARFTSIGPRAPSETNSDPQSLDNATHPVVLGPGLSHPHPLHLLVSTWSARTRLARDRLRPEGFVAPMLAAPGQIVPTGPERQYEVKPHAALPRSANLRAPPDSQAWAHQRRARHLALQLGLRFSSRAIRVQRLAMSLSGQLRRHLQHLVPHGMRAMTRKDGRTVRLAHSPSTMRYRA
jgi:hypothetical protein